jgi:hypothetical protein
MILLLFYFIKATVRELSAPNFITDAIDIGSRYESGVNAIAGTSHYAFSAGLYIHPYALEFGTTIDSHFQFNNLGFQLMAGKRLNVLLGGIAQREVVS